MESILHAPAVRRLYVRGENRSFAIFEKRNDVKRSKTRRRRRGLSHEYRDSLRGFLLIIIIM